MFIVSYGDGKIARGIFGLSVFTKWNRALIFDSQWNLTLVILVVGKGLTLNEEHDPGCVLYISWWRNCPSSVHSSHPFEHNLVVQQSRMHSSIVSPERRYHLTCSPLWQALLGDTYLLDSFAQLATSWATSLLCQAWCPWCLWFDCHIIEKSVSCSKDPV